MNQITLLIAGLFLSGSCLVHAQLATQSAPAKRKFKYPGKIESIYDKTKDETLVFFNLMGIHAARSLDWEGTTVASDEALGFLMYFTYPGQTLTTPKWVGLGIASRIYEPKQYGDYKLTIVADKQDLNIGTLKVQDKGTTRFSPVRPVVKIQELEGTIPYEQFLQIANARKVKMQIGYREIPLDTENLEAIRDLASHTVP
jgi:hypothetical protein